MIRWITTPIRRWVERIARDEIRKAAWAEVNHRVALCGARDGAIAGTTAALDAYWIRADKAADPTPSTLELARTEALKGLLHAKTLAEVRYYGAISAARRTDSLTAREVALQGAQEALNAFKRGGTQRQIGTSNGAVAIPVKVREFRVCDTVEFTGECTPNYGVTTGTTGVVIEADPAAKKYRVLFLRRQGMEVKTGKNEVHPSVLRLLYRPASTPGIEALLD